MIAHAAGARAIRKAIMGVLTFSCPRTGRPIETGIETDEATLLKIASVAIRLLCPHCLEEHDPRVHEGYLATAA
jgi:hypothetical protein